eukprot:Plantae.Rhodophyta-Purpureofilum_apyrenoidigerum.ctg27595.p1 GENE.Plantae.Rhodophyta-Purpureofilum_apyrenoidigerum.ctg27595~~Plantae.Rhodophyta-Purpureofilum_apyrenoidigerum.ctg27595.p1  ORF type:complete len:393 (-),score=72.55 Plantae.Rhodophyta-Purpureofilum_apyrenoidigerum.ctg27595:19-1197(-)
MRADFKFRPGKYELLEVDHTAEPKSESKCPTYKSELELEDTLPCTLDDPTRVLVSMLFEKDLYADAMKALAVDVNKLPLGNLKAEQVQRGVDVLKSIELELNNAARHDVLTQLSSRFYTIIPHDFGRQRPPVISDISTLRQCFDRCDILLDIERANDMMNEANDRQMEASGEKKPHPADTCYASLGCTLELLQNGSDEFEKVSTYFRDTRANNRVKLYNVWKLNRQGETARYDSATKSLDNRKLLWHGTNVAVVAPICKSGLRIMPNSGGRVGKGIYLASENAKSYGYTYPCRQRKLGCMFLVEAALGREYSLYKDDYTLTHAPTGFDSVVARGRRSPSELQKLLLDGSVVQMPCGEVKDQTAASSSNFYQDEYLIYREEQARLRYIVTISK